MYFKAHIIVNLVVYFINELRVVDKIHYLPLYQDIRFIKNIIRIQELFPFVEGLTDS